jgi:hypothetical protein
MRFISLALLLAACSTEPTTTPASSTPMDDLLQQAVPGDLTLEVPPMVEGGQVTMTVTGAQRGETVFFGLSTTGVSQSSLCPSILADCLNIELPLTLLGTDVADASGEASIVVDVPANALYSSLFIQAASASNTSQVAHRFIEPGSACGVGISPADCVDAINVSSGWNCGLGESCQDVYEVSLPAGAVVDLSVTGVTGASVVRMAVFGPGTSLAGDNILTEANLDSECTGQDQDAGASFVASTGGVYRIAVGRDWGSSAGFNGTYELSIASDLGVADDGQSVDDEASLAVDTTCGVSLPVNRSWDCALGESCFDYYDIELREGDLLDVQIANVTGNSVPRFALYGPGDSTSGVNLLTNQLLDRECVGQNVDDSVPVFQARQTGTYRVGIGRDWGSSAGFAGTYEATIRTTGFDHTLTSTGNDVASAHSGSQCGFSHVVSGGWDCALGESCQDVFDLDLPVRSDVTILHTDITGNSVSRLGIFAGGNLAGDNLLTGSQDDLECEGQNIDQTGGPISVAEGEYALTVGRDWGSSAGFSGTYTATFLFDGAYPAAPPQISDDSSTLTVGSVCN